MPFDNRTGQPSLEWIREAAPEILSSRFASAGFSPMSRADRLYALDHLGLPQGFQPSRASEIRLAQTLDADSIVVGSYLTDGTGIVAEARLVNVPDLRMSEPVTARGEMHDLMAVFDALAWKLTRQLDPSFSQPEGTFVAASANLRLEAFEQYIRGISEADQEERLRHLNTATTLSPDFTKAWMALGREEFAAQQYEKAAAALAKVTGKDADGLEAGFYRGLSLLFSGDYPKAEAAFGSVAQVLPLAEVLNNQGVALSRQGKDGSGFFRQAIAADPNEADYHFNLAVSLKRQKQSAEAADQLAQALKLRPGDTEAQALDAAWKEPASAPVNGETKPEPIERIERNFDAVAFRQAALTLEQMDGARLAALTPHERAVKLAAQAKDYLDRGLLLEAERLFQSAEATDSTVAEAHAGLAEVRERTGDSDEARKEAHASLELAPSADAYLVLARLDLSGGHLDEARQETGEALKLEPASKAALAAQRSIEAKEAAKN
jgi:tetratricopeptide (TPR) repeat protein